MTKPPYIHLDLTPDERAVIRTAVRRLRRPVTGQISLKEWAVPILVEEALKILGYPTLEEWVKSRE